MPRNITKAGKKLREAALPALQSDLEPQGLLQLFFACPPQGFSAWRQEGTGLPLFSCLFNLLTVLEPAQLKKLQKLPFYRGLCRLLSYKTLFCGTTVSEFLPLPEKMTQTKARAAAAALKSQAKSYSFVIAKDFPQQQSALVSPAQASAARAFDMALEHEGFISVAGQALAFVPVDYDDLDDYLARFSKTRRKDFRRKLRALPHLKIEILRKGDASFYDEAALAEYYRLYSEVYAQSEIHFDYLSADFFRNLLQNADESLRFFTYRDKAGALIGYNICYSLGDRLVDKYIGLSYPAATEYSLYFVSWFYNLDYARQQNLAYYIAGWTDPQVKAYLGARFTMTRHRVYIRNPLLRAVLRKLRRFFEADAAALAQGAALMRDKNQ